MWNPVQPGTLNRYVYANNNPVRYTDPTGHEIWVPMGNGYDIELEALVDMLVITPWNGHAAYDSDLAGYSSLLNSVDVSTLDYGELMYLEEQLRVGLAKNEELREQVDRARKANFNKLISNAEDDPIWLLGLPVMPPTYVYAYNSEENNIAVDERRIAQSEFVFRSKMTEIAPYKLGLRF